ncbi:rhomboid family intramembrane serine protease [uncultured Corynebacterium sp.]|uniref:rhomboid family intramembrane serine protease n=1 Tax=uncultured Corynebacterium sp. TaxID=159447 RepID=UPI0025EFC615|nr:rhomboid family intramembrane serine protease [uncultured Corynebacterium sp.]
MTTPHTPATTGERSPATFRRSRTGKALITSGSFLVLIWVLMAVNALSNYRLTGYGVGPREIEGLRGILVAPFLHVDVNHLLANTPACAVLVFLIALSGQKAVWVSSVCTVVVGGVGIWLTGPENSVHVGASILIYGWVAFLVLRGFFARSVWQIVLGTVVALVYSGLFWGLFPGDPGVSWQGHLFGAVGGGVAAFLAGRRSGRQTGQERAD